MKQCSATPVRGTMIVMMLAVVFAGCGSEPVVPPVADLVPVTTTYHGTDCH